MQQANPRYEISDEEEARVQAGIAQDPDNPELTEEEFARMRPAREVLPPQLFAALTRDRQGVGAASAETEQVTLELDRKVVDHFRAAGPSWPNLINEALKKAIGADDGSAPNARVT